jgi:hypothetical protein
MSVIPFSPRPEAAGSYSIGHDPARRWTLRQTDAEARQKGPKIRDPNRKLGQATPAREIPRAWDIMQFADLA